ELRVDVRAIAPERTDATLAPDAAAAGARVPDEQGAAGAEKGRVVAATADHSVVAVVAQQKIGALTSDDGVVARAAVEGELDEAGEAVSGGDDVMSSPPLALSTRFSVVPMSRVNGAGLVRSKRPRAPWAVIVKVSEPLPPLTSAVSTPSPPSNRSLPSPGFQIMRSLPAWPNTWSSPAPPINTSLPAPPNSRSLPPLPRRVSLPAPPNSWSLPEPPVSVSLPAPPNSCAAGKAPLVSSSVIVSLPAWPNTWIKAVLPTVA